MEFASRALLWIATHFTADLYLTSTKVQGLAWSGADLVLVFILLRIASLLRGREGLRPIRWRYGLLGATAMATPLLAFAATSRQILLLESAICGTQFLVLAYTLARERARFLALILPWGPQKHLEAGAPPTARSPGMKNAASH